MWGRLSIVAGLVVGVVVAGLLLGGIVALAPDPPRPPAATPSPSSAVRRLRRSRLAGGVCAGRLAGGGVGRALVGARRLGRTEHGAFHIGQPAPALVVPQVGGGTIDLASLKGKPVWINFMATSCPSCQDEFPLMNSFATRYAANGLVVIAVDVREEEAAVAAFGKGLNATFPMGLDTDGKAAEHVGRDRAAGPFLDRQGRHHPRRGARRDRT